MLAEKRPNVLVLKALKTLQSDDGGFEYPNLDAQINGDRINADSLGPNEELGYKESILLRHISDSETDPVEELDAMRAAAKLNLLKITQRLISKSKYDVEGVDDLSRSFTAASEEIYDTKLDREFWNSTFNEWVYELSESDSPHATTLLELYKELGYQSSPVESDTSPEVRVNKAFSEVFLKRYKSTLDLVTDDEYNPVAIAELFNASIKQLSELDGNDLWQEWNVELDDDATKITVLASERIILIGKKRLPSDNQETRAVLAHELFIHANRHNNGIKLSKELGEGLPGSLTAEEGLAMVAESIIKNEIPESLKRRVIAVGIAHGFLGVIPSRQDSIRLAELKLLIDKPEKTVDYIKRKAENATNAMYRGGFGNLDRGRTQAIFTKNLVYSNGYTKMCDYINQKLSDGKSAESILDYLMIGKFDPTIALHVNDVVSKTGVTL